MQITFINSILPNGEKKQWRQAISLDIQVAILDCLGNGEGSTMIGKHFDVGESTIRIIKNNSHNKKIIFEQN